MLAGRLVGGGRNDAAVGDVADHVFELDGGVVNAEVVAQLLFNVAQNALAGGKRNVRDADVAGEGMAVGADAPHVQVVNVVNAFNGSDGGGYLFQFHAEGGAFQQDVETFAGDAEGGPEDESANAKGEGGVNPDIAGGEDSGATADD